MSWQMEAMNPAQHSEYCSEYCGGLAYAGIHTTACRAGSSRRIWVDDNPPAQPVHPMLESLMRHLPRKETSSS